MESQREIVIFELGGCCSSSLLNPEHYTTLQQLDQLAKDLKKEGIQLLRVNAALKPELLNQVSGIDAFLEDKGMEVFPLTVVNRQIVKDKAYPEYAEIQTWLANLIVEQF